MLMLKGRFRFKFPAIRSLKVPFLAFLYALVGDVVTLSQGTQVGSLLFSYKTN